MHDVILAIYPYDYFHSKLKSGQDVDFLRHMFSSYALQSMAGSKCELNALLMSEIWMSYNVYYSPCKS